MAHTITSRDLTLGERLWLSRHRSGESHYAFARRFKVHPDTYLNWERDKFGKIQPNLKKLPELVPTDSELCILARRRFNKDLPYGERITQGDLAEVHGLSRLWIWRMENDLADCSRLLEYWRKQA